MELRVLGPGETGDYIKFVKQLNKMDPLRRDIMSTTLETILSGKGVMAKSAFLEPVLVVDGGRPVAACVFAQVDRMAEVLQLACFEALEGQEEAVALLVARGRTLARERGAEKLLVGLNFHVNYGLGILADHFDEVPTFGSAYHPAYIKNYFEGIATETVSMLTYEVNLESFEVPVSDRLMRRISKGYRVEPADFKHLERTAQIYTEINNAAFGAHRFYYQRRIDEDLELFREFKAFLKPENLLFLYFGEDPVGFMLWYPDFNQLMRPGETIGLKTWLRWKLWPGRIDTMKIVELGVIPEHQSRGGVVRLFEACRERVRGRFKRCEAGWILSENTASRGFGERWADREGHHYKVFLIEVEADGECGGL
ncbi:GNAT family N-acetyltransferase [Acidaminobacter sp.]|uniref:GNAT family N-acetyltransferase n=1 Tax=Acidaminobacter sp. TaxID=1872102 RepID=UPI00256DECE8|nr:GNAT family N-acetyltransferase [Acidaminobacter sp.]MDK9711855.1 GNAT family N-acetyltransferase [Acidaminobacter sp.]